MAFLAGVIPFLLQVAKEIVEEPREFLRVGTKSNKIF
jgi:hypothetical protein